MKCGWDIARSLWHCEYVSTSQSSSPYRRVVQRACLHCAFPSALLSLVTSLVTHCSSKTYLKPHLTQSHTAMALKRKRSTPSFISTSPLSTSSSTSTLTNPDGQLPCMYAQSKPVESLYQKPTWSFPTYESDEPSSVHHLGSRTRKRHRDDRPDESSVHGMRKMREVSC